MARNAARARGYVGSLGGVIQLGRLTVSGVAQVGIASTIDIQAASIGSTITVSAGSLPAGMTLNSGARTITGTPTTPGAASFTLTETLIGGTLTVQDTTAIATSLGITGVRDIMHRPDLIPSFDQLLPVAG